MGRYSRNDGIVTDGTTGGWLVGGSTPPIPILRPTPVPSTFPRPIVPSPRYARPSLADSSCRKQIDLLSFWKITKRSFLGIGFWGSFWTPSNSTRPNWPRKVREMKWTVWYASNKTEGKGSPFLKCVVSTGMGITQIASDPPTLCQTGNVEAVEPFFGP